MYFGSVKFFKHLIVGTTALLIIIPCAFCVALKIENDKKDEQIASLSGADVSGQRTPEEMFELYEASLNDKEKFLNIVYKNDGELYEKAKSYKPAKPENTESTSATSGSEAIPAVITNDPIPIAIHDDIEDDSDDGDIDDDADDAPVTAPEETAHESAGAPAAEPAAASSYKDIYPELYAEGTKNVVYDQDKDYVYLTFDDGPSKYTDNILYYLEKYNIKATFFVVPDGSEQCAERMRKIVDAGHTIGIHTACHVYEDIYESVESYLKDFMLAYERVYDATGVKCKLFRFPGGSINDFNSEVREDIITEMSRRGFVYFDWNVDSRDAMGATWTEMYNTVLTQTANANRAVVLMHDYNGGYNTVLVLEDIIKALMSDSRNYKLAKLTETVRPVQF